MPAALDITGQRFGTLLAINSYRDKGKLKWVCLCDCGNSVYTNVGSLRCGNTTNCGCNRKVKTALLKYSHGMVGTPEYIAWASMKSRCSTDPNTRYYKWYGIRGITVCAEWQNDFLAFYNHIGPRPSSDLSLDRIDNNGNYEPGNVRWATKEQQIANRRPYNTCQSSPLTNEFEYDANSI